MVFVIAIETPAKARWKRRGSEREETGAVAGQVWANENFLAKSNRRIQNREALEWRSQKRCALRRRGQSRLRYKGWLVIH